MNGDFFVFFGIKIKFVCTVKYVIVIESSHALEGVEVIVTRYKFNHRIKI